MVTQDDLSKWNVDKRIFDPIIFYCCDRYNLTINILTLSILAGMVADFTKENS